MQRLLVCLLLMSATALAQTSGSSTPVVLQVQQPTLSLVPQGLSLKPGKTAYVFSGGGSLGSFEVGVARFLINDLKRSPDMLVGCSTGSLNALKLAEGGKAIDEMVKLYQEEIRGYQSIYEMKPWFKQLSRDAKLVMRDGFILGLGFEAFNLKSLAEKAQKDNSTFSVAPLQRLVSAKVSPAKVSASGLKLRMATTNLETGQLVFITETGQMVDRLNNPLPTQVSVLSGVIASASIPGAFPPVMLGTDNFVDGGVREMIPVDMAQRLGADVVFVIYANKGLIKSEKSFNGATMGDILPRTLDILLDEVTDTDVAPSCTSAQRVVFRPKMKLHDSLTFDAGYSSIAMDYGYMLAADKFSPLVNATTPQAVIANRLLLSTAEDITSLRYQIWELEYPATMNFPPENDGLIAPYVDLGKSTMPFRDIDAARKVRDLKLQVKALADKRLKAGLKLPPDAERWWKNWERHSFDPTPDTPWKSMAAGNDQVTEVSPP